LGKALLIQEFSDSTKKAVQKKGDIIIPREGEELPFSERET